MKSYVIKGIDKNGTELYACEFKDLDGETAVYREPYIKDAKFHENIRFAVVKHDEKWLRLLKGWVKVLKHKYPEDEFEVVEVEYSVKEIGKVE